MPAKMKTHGRAEIVAVCLFSGGLDSQLAVCLTRAQGVKVAGIVFETPFFGVAKAVTAAKNLDIPLHVEDFTEQLVDLIEKPEHGLGKGMNPCIDCHAAMLKRAGQWMKEQGYSFLITGEVLGQRPLSQNRAALDVVAVESGYADLVIRPLSAGLLAETTPERLGWVSKDKFCRITGRSRREQKMLADKFNLKSYPQPAGGCRLTEKGYANKIRDLLEHDELRDRARLDLLSVGRHFRAGKAKVIIGRDHRENQKLSKYEGKGWLFLQNQSYPGASALIAADATGTEIKAATEMCAFYSDCPPGETALLLLSDGCSRTEIHAKGVAPDVLRQGEHS